MIILFIIQIVLGAIALGSVSNSRCELDEEMEKSVRALFLKQDDASVKTINSLQRTVSNFFTINFFLSITIALVQLEPKKYNSKKAKIIVCLR